jgi:hypothetical protein
VVRILVIGRFCVMDAPAVARTPLAISEIAAERTTAPRETWGCAGANALGPIVARAAFSSRPLPLATCERQ